LKLIYQNVFGPKHFAANPDFNQIRGYLTHEIRLAQHFINTPIIEEIGGEYVRVSLQAVVNHQITMDDLSRIFYQSMQEEVTLNLASTGVFRSQIDQFVELVKSGLIPLPLAETIHEIDQYFALGIRPIHHSLVYQQTYFPHYRVVKTTIMNL